ncbi:3'-5' exonuclease [Solibacillus sp. FSL K6-1554]|uniref:3'-5' exonuclease n=1 Tax=Solibacillus sp. FSL K6-1554 TaxID=2921472 RepID=UPI0030F61418
MSMPSPIGLQKEVVALPPEGHFIVLGTAGSGKTTMAIYRARLLDQLNKGRVLFVTFNKTLVTYLKSVGRGFLNNVDVVNYHTFARGYLNSVGKMGYNVIVPSGKYHANCKKNLVEQSIYSIKQEEQWTVHFDKNIEFYLEEINVIQKLGISTLEQYINKSSNKKFDQGEKEFIYLVFDRYLEIRDEKGYLYDFEDIASSVLNELLQDTSARRYRHVVIDEGQDLSPIMIESLISAVPSNGSVSYFGDVAQQIYGSDFSWRDAGFRNEVFWTFEQNYRNTIEIAELALKIAESNYYTDIPDMVSPKFPKANGPRPVLVHCDNNSELDFLVNNVAHLSNNESVGILVRTREQVNLVINKFAQNGIKCIELRRDMNIWVAEPTIYVGTIHSAKGLEFDVVCLAFADDDNYPNEQKINLTESYELACMEDIKLLYVGVTRAKRGIFLTFSNKLTELLPSTSEYKYQYSYYNGND